MDIHELLHVIKVTCWVGPDIGHVSNEEHVYGDFVHATSAYVRDEGGSELRRVFELQ